MKKKLFFYTIIAFLSFGYNGFGQTEIKKQGCKYVKSQIKMTGFTEEEMDYAEDLTFRSDTFDIVNYRIKLDVTNFTTKVLVGQCNIDFSPKMENLDYIVFDLLKMNVDSVLFDSKLINYTYNSPFLKIKFDSTLNVNDTLQVSVFYHGVSVIDPSGFGGFYFEKGYAYNLGIGLSSIPHNYGRAWFPCFDNFVERSTYDLDIITKPEHSAYCVGERIGIDTLTNKNKIYHFRMEKQIPTYLVGVSVSDYTDVNWDFEGEEREFPIQLVCNPNDVNNMKKSMAYIPFAIEALEKWFGPYQWSRVGYVLTSHGAMEHPTNVAFPDFLGKGGNPENAMSTMSHELAHHWWGDITTLTTAYDMWIKEGNSEYGHHLFIEHFYGKERFKQVIKSNQLNILTKAHTDDDGFWALSGMPMNHTYGTTTYNKGASVMHNLRTYMGDSLFKQGMRSILEKYRYNHLDAAQFKKQLEDNTGLDLSCFFNDWIYAPGFNAFEIDSIKTTSVGNEFESEVFIEQKLYHAPHYHCNVPLEITFYKNRFEKESRVITVSERFSVNKVILPFIPEFWRINESQNLNIGQLDEVLLLEPNSRKVSKYGKITFETTINQADTIFLIAEHVWGAPDSIKNINDYIRINLSDSHYWSITGEIPEDNDMVATFYYKGKRDLDIDNDLTSIKEDSIQIVYRENPSDDWTIFESQKKIKLSPKDGRGKIKITGIKKGQYCFANIEDIAVNTTNIENLASIYPNPTSKFIHIDLGNQQVEELLIFSILGKQVFSTKNVDTNSFKVDIRSFIPGTYIIKTKNSGSEYKIGKFIVK